MIILDFETTGLIKWGANSVHSQPRITEIGILKVKLKNDILEVVDKFESLVNPEIGIPQKITDITKIHNGTGERGVQDKKPFSHFIPKIKELLLEERILCGHNIMYYRFILNVNIHRCTQGCFTSIPSILLDTQELGQNEYGQNEYGRCYNLTDLYLKVKGLNSGKISHYALNDCFSVFDILQEKKAWYENLKEII